MENNCHRSAINIIVTLRSPEAKESSVREALVSPEMIVGIIGRIEREINNLIGGVTLVISDGNGEGIGTVKIGRGRISPVSIYCINSCYPVRRIC